MKRDVAESTTIEIQHTARSEKIPLPFTNYSLRIPDNRNAFGKFGMGGNVARELSLREIETMKSAIQTLSATGDSNYGAMRSGIFALAVSKNFQLLAGREGFECGPAGELSLSTTSLNEFANGRRKRLQNPTAMVAIYIWLKSAFPQVWGDLWQKVVIEEEERFTFAVREICFKGPPRPEAIHKLSGRYKLYRAFYLDIDRSIMISRLTIGADGEQNYNCKLEMEYLDQIGELVRAEAQGKIVPLAERAFAILASRDNGFFSLYFDFAQGGGTDEHWRQLGGIMTASRDGRPAGAYPFHAVRDDSAFELGVVPNDGNIPEYVSRRLGKGIVRWEY